MYTQDLDDYLSIRHDNGANFWITGLSASQRDPAILA